MTASNPGAVVYEFIYHNIDSVPHLEALVLLWNSRPVWWTCEELASRLYIPSDQVAHLLLRELQIMRHRPRRLKGRSRRPRSGIAHAATQ